MPDELPNKKNNKDDDLEEDEDENSEIDDESEGEEDFEERVNRTHLEYERQRNTLFRMRAEMALEVLRGSSLVRDSEYLESITIEEIVERMKESPEGFHELEIIRELIVEKRNEKLTSFLPGSNLERILEIEKKMEKTRFCYFVILDLMNANEMVTKILGEFPYLERQYVVDRMMEHDLDDGKVLMWIRKDERNKAVQAKSSNKLIDIDLRRLMTYSPYYNNKPEETAEKINKTAEEISSEGLSQEQCSTSILKQLVAECNVRCFGSDDMEFMNEKL